MKDSVGGVLRRGSVVGAAYLSTSAIALVVLFIFARHGGATLLRSILAAHFIATLAAGLEPATTKALALSAPGAAGVAASRRTIMMASGAKALLASPLLAVVWRFSDPSAGAWLLACAPLLCLAGFTATDLRVLFDLKGRHADAIWIKQGSLGGGLVIVALMAASGAPMALAVAAASLARIGLVFAVAAPGRSNPSQGAGADLGELFRDPRWMSLAGASVVAAIGGSADRIFGLRFLSPGDWAAYYGLYEVFSKFWFIPYVLTPIVFARMAAGLDTASVSRGARLGTAAAGAIFVAAVAAVILVAPDLPTRLLGPRLAVHAPPPSAILAFAAAVALNSLAQIRVAELQGRGAAHRALLIIAASALATTPLFYLAARSFGATGLLYAWLGKSLIDLAFAYLPIPTRRERAQ